MQIVERSGLGWSTVNAAINLYKVGGEAALMPAARGRKQGTGRTLTKEQEDELRKLIRVKRPWFYGLKDSLWSRDAVMRLMEQRFAVKLSVRGVDNYLTRWGIALKDPSKQPYERCSAEIRNWLDVNYAAVRQQATMEEAEIWWVNRPVALDPVQWYSQAAPTIGAVDTCIRDTTGSPLFMASVVNSQGNLRWSIINGRFNAERQIKFLSALKKDAGRRALFLIRSDGKLCASPQFVDWTEESQAKVKIFPDSKGGTLKRS